MTELTQSGAAAAPARPSAPPATSPKSRRPVRHYADLVFHKAYADLRAEPERTILGGLWWFIGPLLDCLIYYVVFGIFLNYRKPGYVPFLIVGLVCWRYLEVAINRAAGAIQANVGLLRLTSFRKVVFPLVAIVTCTYEFLFSLVVLFVVLLGLGFSPAIQLTVLPLLVLIELLLILGMGLPIAALSPLYPDIHKFVSYGLRALFYMSGILYALKDLPYFWQRWLSLNPIVFLIQGYRDILLYRSWPDWSTLTGICICGGAGLVAGFALFARLDGHYAKRVS